MGISKYKSSSYFFYFSVNLLGPSWRSLGLMSTELASRIIELCKSAKERTVKTHLSRDSFRIGTHNSHI